MKNLRCDRTDEESPEYAIAVGWHGDQVDLFGFHKSDNGVCRIAII